jgi:hypothetical protein
LNGVFWIVNSEKTLANCQAALAEQWDAERYLRVQIKSGKIRSLDQNALFHVWCREAAKHFKLQGQGKITPEEQMKLVFKANCTELADIVVTDKLTIPQQLPETSRMDLGEMFAFMERCQEFGVRFGLALVASGEYAELKKGTTA